VVVVRESEREREGKEKRGREQERGTRALCVELQGRCLCLWEVGCSREKQVRRLGPKEPLLHALK
jgi:hypothetical protein